MRKDPTIAVAFMGDGATSSNDFHTGMNFAGVYSLPVVMICQNNHWSISMPTKQQTGSRTLAEKAVAYGIPYARIDGNDVLAVYGAVAEAAERARSGNGPSFLEMLTYRIGAHSSSDDPRVYRDEAEVEEWKKRDPVERFKMFLISKKLWSAEKEQSARDKLSEMILETVAVAEARPPPAPETLFEDVFSDMPWTLREQREEFLAELKREREK